MTHPATQAGELAQQPGAAPRLRGRLQARLGAFTLDSGDIDWPLAGVTALFGASGSGKSTVLRALAGLLPQARGSLRLDDEVWLEGRRQLPASRRRIGFVFQHAALFPHLSVLGNLRYAQRRSGASDDALQQQAVALGVESLLDRSTSQLSGGERQRVAIARALLARPRLLLLDEPLSALDWKARDELLARIEALAREQALPLLLVSHAPDEIERLADRVVLVEAGRCATPQALRQVLLQPDSVLFDQLGPVAQLQGALLEQDAGLARLRLAGQVMTVPAVSGLAAGGEARIRVWARDVALARAALVGVSVQNQLPATLLELLPSRAGHLLVRLRLDDGQQLWSEVTSHAAGALQLAPGQQLLALLKTATLRP